MRVTWSPPYGFMLRVQFSILTAVIRGNLILDAVSPVRWLPLFATLCGTGCSIYMYCSRKHRHASAMTSYYEFTRSYTVWIRIVEGRCDC